MKTICLKCGNEGDQKKLVFCINCKLAAEHRYCVNNMPKDNQEFHWTCDECTLVEAKRAAVVTLSRKSERISSKKEVKLGRLGMHKRKCKVTPFNSKEELVAEAQAYCRSPKAMQSKNDVPLLDKVIKVQNSNDQGLEGRAYSRSPEAMLSKRDVLLLDKDIKVQNTNDQGLEGRAYCRSPEAMLSKRDVPLLDKEIKVQNTNDQSLKGREDKGRKRRLILPDEDHSDENSDSNKFGAEVQDSCKRISGNNELKGQNERIVLEGGKAYDESETKDRPSCDMVSRKPEFKAQERRLLYNDGKVHVESKPVESELEELKNSCRMPDIYVPARPVKVPIWRGCLNVKNATSETIFETSAYASTKASPNVIDATAGLPFSLDVKKTLRRPDAWPKCFETSPPSSECIGIYLLPVSESDERVFDGLVSEMNNYDLALTAVINNVELLVFSSFVLPPENRRIVGKYYLWGVYRKKS